MIRLVFTGLGVLFLLTAGAVFIDTVDMIFGRRKYIRSGMIIVSGIALIAVGVARL